MYDGVFGTLQVVELHSTFNSFSSQINFIYLAHVAHPKNILIPLPRSCSQRTVSCFCQKHADGSIVGNPEGKIISVTKVLLSNTHTKPLQRLRLSETFCFFRKRVLEGTELYAISSHAVQSESWLHHKLTCWTSQASINSVSKVASNEYENIASPNT